MTKAYHGISSHQRTGRRLFSKSLDKLLSIIQEGELLPTKIRDTRIEKLHQIVFSHALKNNIYPREIYVEEYLLENIADANLVNLPEVRYYLENKNEMKIAKEYGMLTIDTEYRLRAYTNWLYLNENMVRSTYGTEIYLEFDLPANMIVQLRGQGNIECIVPEPIPITLVKKIKINKTLSGEIPKIRKLLKSKSKDYIKVEKFYPV